MLLRSLAAALRRLGIRDAPVLVAVSGGMDSVSLFSALRELSGAFGLELSIGHVNHGLRGAASDADAALVRELAAVWGVRVETQEARPERARTGSSRERLTLQEAAREVRYAALAEAARRVGATRIATGHHRDDQADIAIFRKR